MIYLLIHFHCRRSELGAVHNLEGCYIFILCVATKKVFKEARQAIKGKEDSEDKGSINSIMLQGT